MIGRSIFDFFHPEDFGIIKDSYEKIVDMAKTAGVSYCGSPYRFRIQNGCYVTMETEWACFINPWSRQLEFIIGHHRVLKGPAQLKIFQPGMEHVQFNGDLLDSAMNIREKILQNLSAPVFKVGSNTKNEASKRCQAMASFMETLMEEVNRTELKIELPPDADITISERDWVMLGEISPHHEYYDSKSSSETPPSYNQLNYNENLNRFFESKPEEADTIDAQDAPPGQQAEDSTGSGSISAGPAIAPIKMASEAGRQSESVHQGFGSSGTGSAGHFSSGSNLNTGSTTNTSNTGTSSGSFQPTALTEALISKHNDDMEKLLLKKHRDIRATSRSEKNKNKNLEGSNKQFMQQCQLQVPTSNAVDPKLLVAQGTKRSGSHSWEGLETYHRTSKHQHLNDDVPPTPNVRPQTNLLSNTVIRSPFTQQSASSLMRNIELWPPFSTGLTSMSQTTMAAPNPYHANPGLFRTMYYIPQHTHQTHQASRLSNPPQPPPPAPAAYQCMAGIMLPHAPLFGQQILYHPMYYQPLVQQPSQPQPLQQTSIEMPTSLVMNSTGYMVRLEIK